MRLLQIGLLGAILCGFGMQAANAQPVGVVRLTDPNTFQQGAARVPGLYDESFLTFRQDIGDGRGYDNGYTSLGAFVTLYKINDNNIIFNNSPADLDGRGLPLRQRRIRLARTVRQHHLSGASFWFDTDESNSARRSRVNQTGVTLEMIRETWGVTASFYNPTSHGNHPLGQTAASPPFFRGNQIIFLNNLIAEQPLTGGDLELGMEIPGFPAIRGYIGGYFYNDEIKDEKWGIKGRLVANLTDAATGQISLANDPLFGTTLGFAVTYAIGPKWQPLRPYHTPTLHQQLFRQVVRTDRIAFRRFSQLQETPAINPRTGNPYFVIHADPNGPAGTGTFENPFNATNFVNSPQADIIPRVARQLHAARHAGLV